MRTFAWPAWLVLTGCASVHQVAASEPHALVELRFEHANRDFLYEDRVRIDGGDEHKVQSGERVRLRPGISWIELSAIGTRYALGTVQVVKPGHCIGALCASFAPVSQSEALISTGEERCAAELDIRLEANSAAVAWLRVAADHTCTMHVAPGARP